MNLLVARAMPGWRRVFSPLRHCGAWLRQRGPAYVTAGRNVWAVLNWKGFADVAGLLFLATLVLYFFREAVLDRRIFFENDTAVFYYPLSEQFDQALREGEFPFWARSIFAGFPVFADSETGMLYPLKIVLHALLSPWQALVWNRIVGFMVAAWGMYAFGRAMGFRPFSAALAGAIFSLGSFLVAQVHHANVIRSAVWLPFVFFALEMGFRSLGRRRVQWLVVAGLGVGMQTLGVHIQVVLMSLLAVGGFIAWRWFWGPVQVRLSVLAGGGRSSVLSRLARAHTNVWSALLQRTVIMMGAGALVIGLGLGIGAMQLLPLYELAQYSNRADGVPYGFASTYALPKLGLLQALSPYVLRSEQGQWWTLWAPWETALYVGLPTLVLLLVGVLFARNRYTFFFLALLTGALWVALGPNAPEFNLHLKLWEVPGFSYMRAPGRFTFLAVFAAAVLAGWGAHWLDMRLSRKNDAVPLWTRLRSLLPFESSDRDPAWRSGLFSLFLGLCVMLPGLLAMGGLGARIWLEANKGEVFTVLGSGAWVQIAGAGQAALDSAFAGLKHGLDPTRFEIAVSLGLLQVTGLVLLVWYGAPRLGYLCKGALLAFVSLDLLLFAAAFHPTISPLELGAPSGAVGFLMDNAGGDRTLLKGGVRSLEPNRTLPYGIPILGGYSSLAPQRHLEYIRPLQVSYDTVSDNLIDAAGIRYIVMSTKFPGFPAYKNASFDPRWPLTQGTSGSRDSRAVFDAGRTVTDTLAVVATLGNSVEIPQDAPLADLTVVSTTGQRHTVTLRAGTHVSEWAHEREDVKGRVRHRLAEKAFTAPELDEQGRQYPTNYYYAEIPLGARVSAQTVEYHFKYPSGNLKLYGLTAVDRASGTLHYLRTKLGYREVYKDQEAIIFEKTSSMPRAYLVGRGAFMGSNGQILVRMLEGQFDPREIVLLEDVDQAGMPVQAMVSETPSVLPPPAPFFRPARFAADDRSHSVIEYDSPSAGYLVLSDSYYPGWAAYLDGAKVPVYRANYLFRAVHAPAGAHTVEFRFESATIQKGFQVTSASVALAAGVLFGAELVALVRVLARALRRARVAWGARVAEGVRWVWERPRRRPPLEPALGRYAVPHRPEPGAD